MGRSTRRPPSSTQSKHHHSTLKILICLIRCLSLTSSNQMVSFTTLMSARRKRVELNCKDSKKLSRPNWWRSRLARAVSALFVRKSIMSYSTKSFAKQVWTCLREGFFWWGSETTWKWPLLLTKHSTKAASYSATERRMWLRWGLLSYRASYSDYERKRLSFRIR